MDLTGGPLMDMTSTSAAAAAGSSNPYTLPLTLLLSLIPSLFNPRGQRDMSALIQYLKPTRPLFMSPNLPALDATTYNAVLNQLARTQNWGWPTGT